MKHLLLSLTLVVITVPIASSAHTLPIDDRYYEHREYWEHYDPRREELRRLDFEIREAREHRYWHRVHELEERREHLMREIEYDRHRRY